MVDINELDTRRSNLLHYWFLIFLRSQVGPNTWKLNMVSEMMSNLQTAEAEDGFHKHHPESKQWTCTVRVRPFSSHFPHISCFNTNNSIYIYI